MDQISHYKILEKIGEGGMGVVYKAEDTRLKRIVAIKFLPRQAVMREEDKARFVREARASALLDHSNICTVYEIDEIEGQTFIVMAYLEGILLKDKIKKEKLSIDDALNIGVQIADGLSEAHAKGIVHRDIKSSNIMISSKEQAKIMDFGLAKSSQLTQITTSGTRMGTVAYMSPEQAKGEEADFRSDIWSLGVVLYEMLSGKLPFPGENIHAVMYAILNEEPIPVQNLRTDIPPELAWIIRKAMTKDLNSRYQGMKEMLSDLRALKKDTGSLLTETIPTYVGQKAKKPKLVQIAVLVAVFLIAATVIFILLNKISPPSQKSIAVLPFKDLSQDKDQEFFCDGMTEAIIGNLSKIEGFRVISRTSVMRYKNTEKNIKEIGKELSVSAILEGSVQREDHLLRLTAQLINVEDDSHIWSEIYNRRLQSVFEVQDELSKSIAKALKIKLTPQNIEEFAKNRTTSVEAYEYYLKGIFYINSKYINSGNDPDFEAGVEFFNKAIALDAKYALAYYGLAWAYEARYVFTRDEKFRNLVIDNCKKAFQFEPDLPEANAAIGWVYFERKDYDNAYKSFKTALSSKTSNSEIYHMSAVFLEGLGLHEQAIKMNKRALELDPLYLYTYVNRAWDYIATGDLESAQKDYEAARKLAPKNASILRGSSYLTIMMGDYASSERFIAEAEKIEPGKAGKVKALLSAARSKNKEALKLFQDDRIFALLGMKKEALNYIEQTIKKGGYNEYQYSYPALQNSVFYRSLKNDARYKNILEVQKKLYESRLKKYGDL
jgi:serine/threonine protein kinase/Flp pilus assembly protein TadD